MRQGRPHGLSGRRVVLKARAAGVWRECNEGPAPAARPGSGAAGVHPAQGCAEVGARRRSQPHTGPQIAAQQQAAQQRHALLQQAVAARGQRILVGRT